MRTLHGGRTPVTKSRAGLIEIVHNPWTGAVTEWWYRGPEASERERELRAVYARELVRADGYQPRAAAWRGPCGERISTESAVTLRYPGIPLQIARAA